MGAPERPQPHSRVHPAGFPASLRLALCDLDQSAAGLAPKQVPETGTRSPYVCGKHLQEASAR